MGMGVSCLVLCLDDLDLLLAKLVFARSAQYSVNLATQESNFIILFLLKKRKKAAIKMNILH